MINLIFLIFLIIFSFFLLKFKENGLLYLLIFMLPFRLEIISISSIGVRLTDVISILFIVFWLIKILQKKDILKKDIWLVSPILLFLVLTTLSFLINAIKYNSLLNTIDLLRLMLAIITGIAIATSIKSRVNLLFVFKIWAVSATLSSLVSIFTFFMNGLSISTLLNMRNLSVIEFYSIKFSNSIFFEDPNNLASYLLISIFITIGLFFNSDTTFRYKYLFLGIQILGLILTMSRGAYIAFILAVIIFILAYKLNNFKWILFKIILTLFVLSLSFPFISSIISSMDSDVSVLSRIGLWNVGIDMTISNPLLGVGIGNSSNLFHQYITSSLVIYNPHFHNLYLTIGSEIGLLGLISFISIFFKHLFNWIKSDDKLYLFLCLGLIAFLIQAFGVEYFASRHFWIFLPLLILYNSKYLSQKGENNKWI